MNFDRLHALYRQPLFDLISQSRAVQLEHWPRRIGAALLATQHQDRRV
jgi:hypothetical protein